MTASSFELFRNSLSNLDKVAPRQDLQMVQSINEVLVELRNTGDITRESLARFVKVFPDTVPLIATTGGLGQEQLKNQLRFKFNTTAWLSLAKKSPSDLIDFLDTEFDVVNQLKRELTKEWTYSDVLVERHLWSKKQGASSVGRGRKIEDEVEKIAKELGLPYEMRTRFKGRANETAPCDLAIPGGMDEAQIVIGMKGFNSTGSKLTDAVVEVEKMASVRLPNQYVFAVIDGIGWLSRQSDLRRIFALWETKQIDGVYTLGYMERLREDIKNAARRLNLL